MGNMNGKREFKRFIISIDVDGKFVSVADYVNDWSVFGNLSEAVASIFPSKYDVMPLV